MKRLPKGWKWVGTLWPDESVKAPVLQPVLVPVSPRRSSDARTRPEAERRRTSDPEVH